MEPEVIHTGRCFAMSDSFAVPEGETAAPSAAPDFLLILVALGGLHAAFLNESRTRGGVQCNEAGNPASLGMTKF
jgi:hypothetical protein